MDVMNEYVFNGKDLAMIVGWSAIFLSAFFKLKNKADNRELINNARYESVTKDLIIVNQDIIHAKNSRASIRKQFEGEVEKIEKRLDNTDVSIRSEFKEINGKLDEIIGYQKGQKDKK